MASDDPFSPNFSGPFQGIPSRTLQTDTLSFSLHILPPSAPALASLLDSINTLAREWTADYIWQRTAFSCALSADGSHLSGTLEYGDAVDDEWFAVALLVEATRRNPTAWCRVSDSDGEFLLIEAAHALPRWLGPEVAEHRVWLRNGRLLVIPMAKGGKRELALGEALEFLQACDPESLLRDVRVEKEALQRTRGYPEAARKHQHRARIVVPRRVAAVLHRRPDAVAAAVEAFYIRDPISLQALKRPERQFAWEDTVEITARFTKVLFAQLKGQMWAPPAGSGFPATEEGRVDVGVKVTAGFEMLMAPENRVLLTSAARRTVVDDLRALMETDLQQLPTDEEITTWDQSQDGEEWLHIDFTEFEKDLKGQEGAQKANEQAKAAGAAEAAEAAYGDPEQEEKLKRMVERFELFLNDDKAGLDGAEFDDDELNSDDDVTDSDDDDGEDKAVSFDEVEFEQMMREMMGLPPDENDQEEEAEIKHIQDQIERELTAAGAIERDNPKIQELKDGEDGDDEEQGDVNIDYTLAKNLLESFKGQGGLSGPGGNLLARMGVLLPRDEPAAGNKVEEVKGKGKEVAK